MGLGLGTRTRPRPSMLLPEALSVPMTTTCDSAVGGAGAGNRLTVINIDQWSGDYTAAGISAISMDLRNLGTTDLNIRLYLEDPIGGPPTDAAVTGPVLLPSGGDWRAR